MGVISHQPLASSSIHTCAYGTHTHTHRERTNKKRQPGNCLTLMSIIREEAPLSMLLYSLLPTRCCPYTTVSAQGPRAPHSRAPHALESRLKSQSQIIMCCSIPLHCAFLPTGTEVPGCREGKADRGRPDLLIRTAYPLFSPMKILSRGKPGPYFPPCSPGSGQPDFLRASPAALWVDATQTEDVLQLVECLPSIYEAPDSIPGAFP